MIIDIDKCIGCGNCVRACKEENDVPREPYYFRTWVERYHVDPERHRAPGTWTRPTAASTASPSATSPATAQELLRAQAVQPLRRFALRAGLSRWAPPSSARTAWCWWTRTTAWAAATACRPAPTAAATSTPQARVDKCDLCYHRITKGLTTACCEACPTGARQLVDLKDPKDPVHEFLRTHKVQVLKPQMATHAKVFYNDLDGSVR